MKLSVREMILASLFTGLTIVGAKINLFLPEVPITLQPVIVMLAGSLLGSRTALLSQVVYIFIGLIGIPVFSKPIAGPAYIFTSTFGYLIGFAFSAYIIGKIIEKTAKKTIASFIFANIIGIAVIYFFGIIYLYLLMNFYLVKPMSLLNAVAVGAAPFVVKDLVLSIAVSTLSFSIYRRVRFQLE